MSGSEETATDDDSQDDDEEDDGDVSEGSDVESEGDGCVTDKSFAVLCKTAVRAVKNLKGDLSKSVVAAVNTTQAQSDLKAIRTEVSDLGRKLVVTLEGGGSPPGVVALVKYILESSTTAGPLAWRSLAAGGACAFDPTAKANLEVQIPTDALGLYASKYGRSANAPSFDEWAAKAKAVRHVCIHKSKLVDLLALTQFASFRLVTAPVYAKLAPKESAALYAATVKRVTRML